MTDVRNIRDGIIIIAGFINMKYNKLEKFKMLKDHVNSVKYLFDVILHLLRRLRNDKV